MHRERPSERGQEPCQALLSDVCGPGPCPGVAFLPALSMASDTPESLMALCTDSCLRNLDGTLGYLLDKETLRLHPDVFLPSEICDRLVNE
ncbi:Protein zer-1 like protein [Tupaia chinensis]|uniref:Protein zer-1 like protein n=1 Tax=Tupaia chinensis TaxID=246437 RepID=L9KH22_TUPCH|nr:Protein zer-1 like protein [Tupaia chinensis]